MQKTDFIADAMLGRLARWLRMLGCDTRFDPAMHDPELVAVAREEGRVLLTRDRHLVTHLRPERAVLVSSMQALSQLREVASACDLAPPFDYFSRCLVCNEALRGATQEEVETLVPARARALGGPFLRCPGCGRAYWAGTHVRRMRAALAEAFPQWFE